MIKPRAAAVCVFRHGEVEPEIAVGIRRGEPEKGVWGYPGGGVDPDENPRDGAARELHEEAGVLVDPANLTYIITQQNTHWVYIYAIMVNEDCALKSGSDMEGMRWIPLSQLPKLAFNGNKYVAMAARKMKLGEGSLRPKGNYEITTESLPSTIADLITEDPDSVMNK